MALALDSSFQATTLFITVIAAVVYGVTIQELAHYTFNYPADGHTLKLWVYAIWAVTTAGLALDSYNAWYILSQGDGTYVEFTRITLPIEGILHALTVYFVQLFFIVRIHNVRKKVYPRSLLTTPMVLCYALIGLTSAATAFTANGYLFNVAENSSQHTLEVINAAIRAKICLDLFLDIFITATLVKLLFDHRNEFASEYSPFKMSPIERLIIFFASRGVIIMTAQTVFFILIFTVTSETVSTALVILMPKIYAASMIVTVTNRDPRRGETSNTRSRSRSRHASAEAGHGDLVLVSFVVPEAHDPNEELSPVTPSHTASKATASFKGVPPAPETDSTADAASDAVQF